MSFVAALLHCHICDLHLHDLNEPTMQVLKTLCLLQALSRRTSTLFPASPTGSTFADWLETFSNRLLSGAFKVKAVHVRH